MGPCGKLIFVILVWISVTPPLNARLAGICCAGLSLAVVAGGYDGIRPLAGPKEARPVRSVVSGIGLLVIAVGAAVLAIWIGASGHFQ